MRWSLKPKPESEIISHIQEALGVSKSVATLLVQRGITTYDKAKAFFRPNINDIHDPFLMKDMDKAVERINKAIQNEEHILVYGDYDVDGTTAVSLMSAYLRSNYDLVTTYIPDRYAEGYGISFQGIDYAHDNDCTLIIALDCGIKAIDKVAYAKEKGIDFIICDHHKPGDYVPEAVAVLNPKQLDCNYPYDELSGCGVGFKLIQALAQRDGHGVESILPYLDLVAISIAADIVPITGENRILAYYGLQIINTQPRIGVSALIHGINKSILTITDVVFIIAPRINAAGRIKHGNHAVALLTSEDFEEALGFASEINDFNTERRDLDKAITKEALQTIRDNDEVTRFTTVVYNESWHKGVIGIVASRLIETYYRPTLVFTKSGNKLAASARSVKGFDVYDALEQCSDCIEQFGGHKYAAGLTLLPEQYETFKARFETVVKNTIDKKLLVPELSIDLPITFNEITPKFYRLIKQMAPFGPGNMKPVFMSDEVKDTGYAKCVGADNSHLKASLKQVDSLPIGAIGFGLGDKLKTINKGNTFKVAFSIDENEWQGNISLQLLLKDIKQ